MEWRGTKQRCRFGFPTQGHRGQESASPSSRQSHSSISEAANSCFPCLSELRCEPCDFAYTGLQGGRELRTSGYFKTEGESTLAVKIAANWVTRHPAVQAQQKQFRDLQHDFWLKPWLLPIFAHFSFPTFSDTAVLATARYPVSCQ